LLKKTVCCYQSTNVIVVWCGNLAWQHNRWLHRIWKYKCSSFKKGHMMRPNSRTQTTSTRTTHRIIYTTCLPSNGHR
jgi:hypothetical protein